MAPSLTTADQVPAEFRASESRAVSELDTRGWGELVPAGVAHVLQYRQTGRAGRC